jgi:hypothetical protein
MRLLGKTGDGVGDLRDVKLAHGLDDLDEMRGEGVSKIQKNHWMMHMQRLSFMPWS